MLALVAVALTTSCIYRPHRPDPLAGWKLSWSQDPDKVDAAIVMDYKEYIGKLPPKERERVGSSEFFEDGAGRHAVRIEIGIKGTWWQHVLIYDKNSRRIERIKYASGGYHS